MNRHARSFVFLSLMLLVSLGSVLAIDNAFATESSAADSQSIGQATLVIGQAHLVNESGRQVLTTGMQVHSQDTLVTGANGHVHLRFIDDALVSVRPNSQLKIQTYHYDEHHPEQSEVKFDLQSGAARAVSGRAAHAAHDRFRLNTPIAAIGVRGTDFIVSTNDDRVRAFVNEGAIVVGAFSDLCQAAGTGPCAGGVELRGGTQQLLEIDRLAEKPRLIEMSLEDALKVKGIEDESHKINQNSAPATDSESDTSEPSNEKKASHHSDTSSPEAPAQQKVSDSTAENNGDSKGLALTENAQGDSVAPPSDDKEVKPGDLEVSTPTTPEETPASDVQPNDLVVSNPQQNNDGKGLGTGTGPLQPDDLLLPPDSSTDPTLSPLDQRQLVWGHWGAADDSGLADFSFPYDEVSDGRVELFSSSQYSLLRRQGDAPVLLAGLGTVYFDLLEGEASFIGKDGTSSEMQFVDGALNIDFKRGTFGTLLRMSSDRTGQVSFIAAGDVDSQGNLTSKNPKSYIWGASSLNGQEAAYMFRRIIEQGYVDGITLWGVK